MRDLEKYDRHDLINYCTKLEVDVAVLKNEIEDLKNKLKRKENENENDKKNG